VGQSVSPRGLEKRLPVHIFGSGKVSCRPPRISLRIPTLPKTGRFGAGGWPPRDPAGPIPQEPQKPTRLVTPQTPVFPARNFGISDTQKNQPPVEASGKILVGPAHARASAWTPIFPVHAGDRALGRTAITSENARHSRALAVVGC